MDLLRKISNISNNKYILVYKYLFPCLENYIVSFFPARTAKETATEQKKETVKTQEDFFEKVFCRQSANATSN